MRLVRTTRKGGTRGQIDVDAAERAAADLLLTLGVDLSGEGVRDTPRRMVAAYAELLPRTQSALVLPAVDWEACLLIDGGVVNKTPLSHAPTDFGHAGVLRQRAEADARRFLDDRAGTVVALRRPRRHPRATPKAQVELPPAS